MEDTTGQPEHPAFDEPQQGTPQTEGQGAESFSAPPPPVPPPAPAPPPAPGGYAPNDYPQRSPYPPSGHAPRPGYAPNDYPQNTGYAPNAGYPPAGYGPRQGYAPNDYPQRPAQPAQERRGVSGCVKWAGGCLVAVALLMAMCAAGAGVLAAVAHNSEAVSDTVARSVSVTGVPTVQIRGAAVNVSVHNAADGQVVATLHKVMRGFSRQNAESDLRNITLTADQSGTIVTITVHSPSFDGFPGWFDRHLDLDVAVPAKTNLDLQNQAGNVDVNGISGQMTATLTAGNLEMRGVSLSDASQLRMTAGNLTMSGELAPTATLDVTNTAGNVTLLLPLTTPAHVSATSSAGNVTISGWPQADNLSTANGNVSTDLNANPTAKVTVHVTAGNVRVEAE